MGKMKRGLLLAALIHLSFLSFEVVALQENETPI